MMSHDFGRVMLTHVGHKRLLEVRRSGITRTDLDTRLDIIERHGISAVPNDIVTALLFKPGWIQLVSPDDDEDAVRVMYRRNPLENVRRINYEITTQCNFTCAHCRNGGVADRIDTDVEDLVEAGRVFLSLGIRRYDFIGGEVSKYGNGWLNLSNLLRDMDEESGWPEPLAITLYTNGWWLERKDIQAAGNHYPTEADYLAALKANGVSHVLFSIDGPEALHDNWRKHSGLFRRILNGLPRVISAGIQPRLSVVIRPGDDINHLKPFSDAIYGAHDGSLSELQDDSFNHFSNLIDVGRASEMRVGQYSLAQIPATMTRCKAFFRPAPTLRIMANGEIGICPLMHGEEGYGNIHQRPVVELLNTLHEKLLYRLHASGEISRYLKDLDRDAFGNRFDHACAVRIALNRLALAGQGMYVGSIAKSYHAQVWPEDKPSDEIPG